MIYCCGDKSYPSLVGIGLNGLGMDLIDIGIFWIAYPESLTVMADFWDNS